MTKMPVGEHTSLALEPKVITPPVSGTSQ